MELTSEEMTRYSRHLNMSEFGIEEQLRLKASKVLVIGAGGLGSPLLLYLAAAGIGTIGIVEFDTIDLSNIQRQILYNTIDIDKSKIEVATNRLSALNPNIQIIKHNTPISSKNARSIIHGYDIVADGTDNFPSRYLINDACVLEGKPNVYGSVLRFEGQVSVFNVQQSDGSRGPNYRDIFPTPPPDGLVPNCAEAGVLGVLPGIIGSMQANEVIKIASDIGTPLSGRMWIFDALAFESRILKFKKRADNRITELIDYESFCGITASNNPEITPKELLQKAKIEKKITLIDVREVHEFQADNLGGENLPLSNLRSLLDEVDLEGNVIVHCQIGKRSAQAIILMQEEFPDVQFQNLKGGLNHWRKTIGDQNPI